MTTRETRKLKYSLGSGTYSFIYLIGHIHLFKQNKQAFIFNLIYL